MTIFFNLLHTFRNTLLALFLTLPLLSNTDAASAANIQITHCTNCDKVLVGAARIDFNGIRWNTQETVGSLNLETVAADFGFSGDSIYLTAPSSDGVWKFSSTKRIAISNPSNGISMNHFFAPTRPGTQTASHLYYTLLPDDNRSVRVTGEGVADDPTTPAITLVVTANSTQSQIACESASCQIPVQLNKTVTFTVIPKLNSSAVPSQVRPVEYILVNLRVEEHNTPCTRNSLSFKDKGLGKKNSRGQWGNIFAPDNYYHYLNGAGPDSTPQTCLRNYSFLTRVDDDSNPAINKSFSFQATNTRDTGTGYAEYVFYVNGHYDPNNPNLNQYPGSWKSLRLTNSQVPIATFTVTPSSGQAPLTVNLDTSGSSETPTWTVTKNQQPTNLMPTLTTGNQYTLTLSEEGNYDIILTTTTVDGKQSASATRSVTVTAPPVVEQCGFPVYNPTDVSVTLPCVNLGPLPQQITLVYKGQTDKASGYYWQVFSDNRSCQDSANLSYCLTPGSNGELTISQANQTNGQELPLTEPVVFKPYDKQDGILYWEYIPPSTTLKLQTNFTVVQNTLTEDNTMKLDLTGTVLPLNGENGENYHYQWEITSTSAENQQTVNLKPGDYTIKLNITDAQGNIVDTVSQLVTVSPEQTNSNYNLHLDQGNYLAQVILPPSSDSPAAPSWSLEITTTPENWLLNPIGFSSLTPASIAVLDNQDTTVTYQSDLPAINIYQPIDSAQPFPTNNKANEQVAVSLNQGNFAIKAEEKDPTHPRWNVTLWPNSKTGRIKVNGQLNSADGSGGYVLFGVDSSQPVEFQVSGAKPLDFKVLKYDGDTREYDIPIYSSPK